MMSKKYVTIYIDEETIKKIDKMRHLYGIEQDKNLSRGDIIAICIEYCWNRQLWKLKPIHY